VDPARDGSILRQRIEKAQAILDANIEEVWQFKNPGVTIEEVLRLLVHGDKDNPVSARQWAFNEGEDVSSGRYKAQGIEGA
jgi:hypothetical protein